MGVREQCEVSWVLQYVYIHFNRDAVGGDVTRYPYYWLLVMMSGKHDDEKFRRENGRLGFYGRRSN